MSTTDMESSAEDKELLPSEKELNDNEISTAKKYTIIVILLFLQFMARAADTMVFPFYPEKALAKGLTMKDVGIVYAVYDLARFIFSPILGSILLQWPPKSMCFVGTLITGGGSIIFGCIDSTTDSGLFLALCILLRGLAGVGSAMISISTTSILLKSSGFLSSTIIGVTEIVIGVAYAFGAALGGFLYEFVGYIAVFFIIGGVTIVALLPFGVVTPNIVEKEKSSEKNFFKLMTIPGCIIMYLACVMVRVQDSSRNVCLADLYRFELERSSAQLGLLYAIWSAVYMLCCAVFTKFFNKFPQIDYSSLIVGWMLVGVTLMLLGPSPLLEFIFHGRLYFWLSTIDMVFIDAIFPLVYLPPFVIALNLAEVHGYKRDSLHTYGMITGLINSGWGLGASIGPVISGVIIDAQNAMWNLTYLSFAAFVMGFIIGVYYLYMKLTNQPTKLHDTDSHLSSTVKDDCEDKDMSDQAAKVNRCVIEQCPGPSANFTKIHLQQPASSKVIERNRRSLYEKIIE
ncbi:MFS-type transporter SLC18B1-like [Watersipora subatra]|uniref:MFS-type transporter SLC18B1-like n=1 Tax=Watersipora subatra TaxID=2589382 RepID=UPI00355BC633